jgi:hypothetical protein
MTAITFQHTEFPMQREPDQRTTLPPLPDTSNWPYPKPIPCQAKQADDGRCIITVKSTVSLQPVNAACQTTTFHDPKDFWNIDLEEMLLRLGQKVIQGDQSDEWLSMKVVASLCRRYRLKWQEGSTNARHLEECCQEYMDKHGEITGGGVQVEYKTEFDEDKRRGVVFLKFRKWYGDASCS